MSNGAYGAQPTQADAERAEQLKKTLLQNVLDKAARERLNRVRMVKPELAAQIELYLIQLYEAGKLRSQMTDAQLKDILEMLAAGPSGSGSGRFKIVKK
ncbi:MAG: DNA-binding protein [Candidatus Aenigmarchaeota archaeon]|nr:DNA-binding protein [Candidatus Aenigmarchaeota archaeon]